MMDANSRNRECIHRDKNEIVCPECFGTDVRFASCEEYRSAFFLIRRPYTCVSCGLVFPRPAHAGLCWVVAGGGVTLGTVALIEEVVPAISGMFGAGETHGLRAAIHFVVGVLAAAGFGCISYSSVKAAYHSRRYHRHIAQHTPSSELDREKPRA